MTNAEETKNHDLELLASRAQGSENRRMEEYPRNAARLATHGFWIIVMDMYWALADYGRSFAWPFTWLIASSFFFYWCYGKILAQLAPKACPLADQYVHAVRMLALGNTVPFIEIKKFIFCPLNNCPISIIPPEGYQLAVLSQNLISINLVFFIGLVLRNYFKINLTEAQREEGIYPPAGHRLHHMLDMTLPTCNFGLIPIWNHLFGTWRGDYMQLIAIGVSTPYRNGARFFSDLWRDYCDFLKEARSFSAVEIARFS